MAEYRIIVGINVSQMVENMFQIIQYVSRSYSNLFTIYLLFYPINSNAW